MFTYRPAPKPSHKRGKLTNRQRTELSASETKRLYKRSGGVCERCDRERATDKAHLERRWKSESRPVAEDFAHLCILCHRWADTTADGRKWLLQFKQRLERSYISG